MMDLVPEVHPARTGELWYTYRMAKKRTDLKIPYGVFGKVLTKLQTG